ncbi:MULTISPECIES: hypothetical protein [unclassified Pseudoclavibacter]|uniref:hypothetical protein n=1 Tax=unclassified Pseudoclavibacter TaxID=2615177 RepID=UPI001BA45CF7|nr:hypothetical protein [Pseudoclavibacter sp. Marseille-Q4354]MBS3180531.1 hypothetical protein [Pseudoclavibacter sp. Marseille-Q4354]
MTSIHTLNQIIADAASAPSAHNTQPWSPRMIGDGEAVELRVARTRTLPASDPTGRDTLLGLGAWLEAFSVSAAAHRVDFDVELLPALADPEAIVHARSDEPVLRIQLRQAPDDGGDGQGSGTPNENASESGSASGTGAHEHGTAVHTPDSRSAAAGGATPASSAGPDSDRQLLASRKTVRSDLAPAKGLVIELASSLPDWLRLVPVDADDLRHFSSLGTADTLRDPAVARELAHWLRLHPTHPRYHVDGLNDRVLGLPAVASRLVSPFTRNRRLREAAVRIVTPVGELWRRALLEVPVSAAGEDAPAAATAFVLVADSKLLDLGSGAEVTRVLNSPLGLPPERVLEAGQALMRLWLMATARGAAFAPASEIIDSSLAQGELRYRLGLSRRDVPLFVTRVGAARDPNPPRAPRR